MHLRGHHPDNLCVCVCSSQALWVWIPAECCGDKKSAETGAATPPPPPLPKMNKLRDDESSSTNPKHQMENQMGWRPGNDNERLKGFQ